MQSGVWFQYDGDPDYSIEGYNKRVKVGDDEILLKITLSENGECAAINVDLKSTSEEDDIQRLTLHSIFADINEDLADGKSLYDLCLQHIHNGRDIGHYIRVKGDDYIKQAASIMDYVFTSLATEFNIEIPNLVTTVAQRDAQRVKLYSLFPGITRCPKPL